MGSHQQLQQRHNFGYNGEHPSVFTAGNNENIDNDKTKQQSMDKAAMSLVISMKPMCCSCFTQPLHCHFGWLHWHTRPRPCLVISGYYGHCSTPQQQQKQWRTNDSGRTQHEFDMILFWSCCVGQSDLCCGWKCQW